MKAYKWILYNSEISYSINMDELLGHNTEQKKQAAK